MEELLEVLDEEIGEKTGELMTKEEAHKKGKWYESVHVLIVSTDKKRTLIQKRCKEKKLFPNIWDISVGGHISKGEDRITSAKREISEELGIGTKYLKLENMDRIKERLIDSNGMLSNHFSTIFLIYIDFDIKNLKLQKEEVSEAKWCTKKELNRLINNNKMVPHKREFEILNEILID